MACLKITITVPEEIVTQVDDAARKRGESRSTFISRVLRAALRAHDGQWRKIRVAVSNHPEAVVRTRKGYYARKDNSVSGIPGTGYSIPDFAK